jgi:hypothetical protein
MIQRIQSVWLLLSGLSILLLSRLSIYAGKLGDGTAKEFMAAQNLVLMLLSLVLIILPLIAIFMYKNRIGQKKLIWLHILLNVLLIFLFWIFAGKFESEQVPEFSSSHYGLAAIVPILSFIFDVLAYRGISADEKLIKAADKFR